MRKSNSSDPPSRTKKDRMNFSETLLDAPIKRKRTVRDNKFYLVPLPEP